MTTNSPLKYRMPPFGGDAALWIVPNAESHIILEYNGKVAAVIFVPKVFKEPEKSCKEAPWSSKAPGNKCEANLDIAIRAGFAEESKVYSNIRPFCLKNLCTNRNLEADNFVIFNKRSIVFEYNNGTGHRFIESKPFVNKCPGAIEGCVRDHFKCIKSLANGFMHVVIFDANPEFLKILIEKHVLPLIKDEKYDYLHKIDYSDLDNEYVKLAWRLFEDRPNYYNHVAHAADHAGIGMNIDVFYNFREIARCGDKKCLPSLSAPSVPGCDTKIIKDLSIKIVDDIIIQIQKYLKGYPKSDQTSILHNVAVELSKRNKF